MMMRMRMRTGRTNDGNVEKYLDVEKMNPRFQFLSLMFVRDPLSRRLV
jgi:hypothetical protein